MARPIGPALTVALLLLLAGAAGSCTTAEALDPELVEQHVSDQAPKQLNKLELNYDNSVKLLGYTLDPASGHRPGMDVKLTMYWQAEAQLGEGWNLFTHILDEKGERLLNIDNVGPLRQWRGSGQVLGPSKWEVGKVYRDPQVFTIPRNARTKRVEIVAGLWKGEERLPLVKGPKDDQNRGKVVSLSLESRKPKKTKKQRKKRRSKPPRLRVRKLTEGDTIKIDGVLDEQAWRRAARTPRFVDVGTGRPNKKFPVNGRARMTFDDEFLYVAFEIEDADVSGKFDKQERDPHLWTADAVELMIDPDGNGDNKDYYEIQVNPQNLVFDSRFDHYNRPRGGKDGPFGHEDWSAKLTSAVTINGTLNQPDDKDKGYVVELKIPWKSFSKAKQVPPKPGQSWRMNFYAMQDNGGVAWSPILGKGNFHKASRFGSVTWEEARSREVPRDRKRGPRVPLVPRDGHGQTSVRGRFKPPPPAAH